MPSIDLSSGDARKTSTGNSRGVESLSFASIQDKMCNYRRFPFYRTMSLRCILPKALVSRWMAASFAALLFYSSSAEASTVASIDLPEMVERADLVADITVTNVTSYWASPAGSGIIRTRVSFSLNRPPIKGQVTSPFSLDFLGGTVGDRTVRIEGMPKFSVGQRLIIFSHGPGTAFASPVIALDQGALQVVRDNHNNIDRVYRLWGQPVRESEPFTSRIPASAETTADYLRSADSVDTFLARVSHLINH